MDKGRTVWVTRSRPKVDRIACPWLIRRFIDPNAVFLFVLPAEVTAVAERFNATPFDIDGVFWSHRGETCTFDTMIEEFALKTAPLLQLAKIVRGADTARPDLAPQVGGSAGRVARLLAHVSGTISRSSRRRWASTTPCIAGAATRQQRPTTGRAPSRGPDVNDARRDPVAATTASEPRHMASRCSEAFWTWMRVAALSFGGPAGQIAVMHRILVEEKRWVSEERFLHALNYCMLLPGPEAQQLATYIGWLMHRTLGGIMAGGLFVVPGIISIMALSYIYAGWGNVPIVAALFFGLKAAVLAIVIEAVVRIGKRSLKNRALHRHSPPRPSSASSFSTFRSRSSFLARRSSASSRETMGVDAFQGGGGHGPSKTRRRSAVVDSLLGDELPEHARPTVARALKSLVRMAGALADPGRRCARESR